MTERATTLSPRSRPGAVVLVLAVLVPVLLWTGTGNTFAAHMGAGPDMVDHRAAVDPGHDAGAAASSGSLGTVPHDAQSSHALHLLGGCIAVLGAALLLLGAWRGSQAPPGPAPPPTAGVTLAGHTTRSRWRQPALSPPTTSPVMRT